MSNQTTDLPLHHPAAANMPLQPQPTVAHQNLTEDPSIQTTTRAKRFRFKMICLTIIALLGTAIIILVASYLFIVTHQQNRADANKIATEKATRSLVHLVKRGGINAGMTILIGSSVAILLLFIFWTICDFKRSRRDQDQGRTRMRVQVNGDRVQTRPARRRPGDVEFIVRRPAQAAANPRAGRDVEAGLLNAINCQDTQAGQQTLWDDIKAHNERNAEAERSRQRRVEWWRRPFPYII